MKTITFDISDRDYKLLSQLAELRGLTTTEVAREQVLESRHTIPAQINFLRRVKRGHGREQRGLELLDKAAGIESDDPNYKTPNAKSRAAMCEVKLMSRLSDLSREVIDGIDLYSLTHDKLAAKKITKR